MRSKRLVAAALIAALSCGSAISSMAAYWESVGTSDWKYVQDDGTYAAGKWIQHTDGNWYYLKADTMMAKGWVLDPTDGHWYFTDSNGALVYGWIEVNGSAYYMNETHDGTFGALFVGTKDGYNCTENGTTNGKPVARKKFNSDGSAIVNMTTTSSHSYGGSSGGYVPSTTNKDMDNIATAVEAIADDYVSVGKIEASPAENNTSTVTVALAKDADLKDSAVVAEVKTAATEAVAKLFEEAEARGEVENITVMVPGFNGGKAKSVTKADIDKYIGMYVDYAHFDDKYLGTASQLTFELDGKTITYNFQFAK